MGHTNKGMGIEGLDRDHLIRLIGVFLGEALVHYGMWFSNTALHEGLDQALDLESRVWPSYGETVLKRLAPHLGIELRDGVPDALAEKGKADLIALLQDIAKTWLTSDGLWFQALEGPFGMCDAKLVNDHCWFVFARMEAHRIRRFLGIGEGGGLQALEKALRFRIYSSFNEHEALWEDENTLVWRMLECRVQTVRRRKEMDDYPCKSAGIVEYSRFAQGIDPRIKADCIICPPDKVPAGLFCAWKFTLDYGATH